VPERKGLLVDYGGVLTTPIIDSFQSFCTDLGLPRDLVGQVFLSAYEGGDDSVICQVETGRITLDQFAVGMAEALSAEAGVPMDPDTLVSRLFDQVELDERMLDAVATLRRAGVRTALLSNSWGESGYPRERFPDLFDAVVISGEVGLRKPDAPIYRLAADRIGLAPPDCVFIDDLEHNVRAAEALGMAGVVHRGDADETLPRVAELLGLDHAELFAA
jgi:putative hydrolase of the HAD superfamily